MRQEVKSSQHVNPKHIIEQVAKELCWGIQLASEKTERQIAKEQQIASIHSEAMPFAFNKNGGGTEIRFCPCAQVIDLKTLVYGQLEENMK
ncbi:MAG: hypothetical protein DSY43_00330 [Gammaproteobacteria bacterium]|nr:MAG: hypothetical protein DSY43_00330 [Gammaproteobacteria bacterium]